MNEKSFTKNPFSSRYCIISRSEPRYDLLSSLLRGSSRLPAGSSQYFIRAEQNQGSLCRIRAHTESVLFYEILDNLEAGITDEEIQDALQDPANACPLPGYFYVTPAMEERLQKATGEEPAGNVFVYIEPHPA